MLSHVYILDNGKLKRFLTSEINCIKRNAEVQDPKKHLTIDDGTTKGIMEYAKMLVSGQDVPKFNSSQGVDGIALGEMNNLQKLEALSFVKNSIQIQRKVMLAEERARRSQAKEDVYNADFSNTDDKGFELTDAPKANAKEAKN